MQYIEANWPAPKHIKAFTTTKQGWGGRKPHHDLNKGNYDATNPDYIVESQRLEKLLKLPNEPIWLTQTHTTKVIEATPENKEQNADASFTNQKNRVSVVLTADCLPILICDKKGTHVAAIHAGWRGLANGIIENTLQSLNLPSEDLYVWLGPAIGPNKFEVGKDVYDAFINQHPQSSTAFAAKTNTTEPKWLADLYVLAKIRLQLHGVTDIYGGGFCTYTQDDLFFSYRRDHGKTGRMASLIWIDSK